MRLALLGLFCCIGFACCAPLLVSKEVLSKEDRYRRQCEATPHRSLFAISDDGLLTCYIGAGNCAIVMVLLPNWLWNRQRTMSKEEIHLLEKHGLDENAGNVCVFDASLDLPARTTSTTTTKKPTPTITQNRSKCHQNYKPFEGMCYNFIHKGNATLVAYEADTICQRIPGGMLAVIPNERVNSFVNGLIPIKNANWVAFGLICPFMQYLGDRDSCYWIDGTPLRYHSFERDYPRHTGECCNFNYGQWGTCWGCSGDNDYYGSICQAPMF